MLFWPSRRDAAWAVLDLAVSSEVNALVAILGRPAGAKPTHGNSPELSVLYGTAFSNRLSTGLTECLESRIGEGTASEIEIRALSRLLPRGRYQPRGERFVPLESQARHIPDDSFQLLLGNISR